MKYDLIAKEESFNFHGLSFLCIYGKHINGGFVAITNWGICTELSFYNSVYNCSKILYDLERSIKSYLLPSSKEARYDIVSDLAELITELIMQLSD